MVIHLFALLFSLFSLYLTLGEHVRQTIQTYRCPRLIEFFLSLFCSHTRHIKKKTNEEEEGMFSDCLEQNNPLFPSLSFSSIFLLQTKQEIIICVDVSETNIERERRAIRKEEKEKETFRLHTLPCHHSRCRFPFPFETIYFFFRKYIFNFPRVLRYDLFSLAYQTYVCIT